ncbi:PREDICTED: uncharacterized protein LOC109167829 [Ipomoea nil]|uniref:uncharacterized protein LOC109167829 n=1 Tax=Ipomoea nil TaxID=35883 RepID=UPI000901F4D0|nr:PREDICTED: uncharacterized protein LOC109167829 [Ipomoea nil]
MDQGQNKDIVLALPANPKAHSSKKRKINPKTTALDQGQNKEIVLALPAKSTANSFTTRGYVVKMKEKTPELSTPSAPVSTNEANPIDEQQTTPIEKPSAAM